MSLIFTDGNPREMPTMANGFMPFNSAEFEPLYNQSKAATRGSKAQVANLAPELWQMSFASPTVHSDVAMDYLAWISSLDGGEILFKAWHPHLRFPRNYKRGFGGLTLADGATPFDGTCAVESIGTQLDTITLVSVPKTFSLQRYDMVSMPFGPSRTLHRLIAPAVANNLGKITVTVRPRVPISFMASPEVIATFVKPWCLAVIDASSIRGPFGEGQTGSVSFSAVQTY